MNQWTQSDLEAIDAAQEMTIAPARDDGTLRRPVTIWVVRVGDDVYVRSVDGRGSAWFRGAQTEHRARIRADGIDMAVSLLETDEAGEQIDDAYHAKYGDRYPTIVPSIVAPRARVATLKLVPPDSDSRPSAVGL